MQVKNERLEYRLQHLVSAVKETDAALAAALSADDTTRRQLQEKYAYLLQGQATSQSSASVSS